MHEIRRRPPLDNDQLNALFADSWPDHDDRDYRPILERSLSYLATFSGNELVGFLNIAWDGGAHGFVLDVTVARKYRRKGVALAMLRETVEIAREAELEWLHVDFEPYLEGLYRRAGYRPTEVGLLHIPSCGAA